ncbi:DUF6182 family protein [Streptomyces sp. NPDC008313]|uniref:DUF6182 family protein n=1 Tax=Streptomyces sp. NPDC008313 TaxID=3364826 RepID=UPI0036F0E7D7
MSQQLLRDESARRVREARPELAARVDLSTDDGLLAAHQEITGTGQWPRMPAVCVLRAFEPAVWLREVFLFARRIGPGAAAAWRQDFTRTVFLAGNPGHLRERFAFAHVADDGTAAWLGPAPAGESTALRRLLKVFPADAALPTMAPAVIELPADGPAGCRAPVQRELHLATAGLTVGASLVHLHHLVCEAVLDGLLEPGDRLALRPVPRLVGVRGPFAALRVGPSDRQPYRLRAHAALGAGSVP